MTDDKLDLLRSELLVQTNAIASMLVTVITACAPTQDARVAGFKSLMDTMQAYRKSHEGMTGLLHEKHGEKFHREAV